jgi:tRNA-2-methylthio-N6-dimethylallyladenosine synthase
LTRNEGEADVILFNTCSIREHAEHKVFSRLGRLAGWKREKEGRVLGVLGCMATSYKERILERAPQVDMVVGPDQYLKVPQTIREAAGRSLPQVLADFDPHYFPQNDPTRLSSPHKAFIEVMKGCDKFCTFCVVPFTRGREVSRPMEDILKEVRELAQAGVKEVMLLGQNVNSYGLGLKSRGKSITFPELLRQVGSAEGIQRVRFMTSHPMDLSDELAAAMADTPSVCESLHLPVQCGSDRILKRMGRKYDTAHYLDRVGKLRASIPDLFLTTDLIVGFPGETEEDFQGTLDLLERVRYDAVYSFKYSPRLGTPAARMLDQVPEEVKDERLARLNQAAWKHASESCEGRLGKMEEVLVEGPADRTPGAFYGKTRQNRTVIFPAPPSKDTREAGPAKSAEGKNFRAGDFVQIKVTGHKVANLHGEAVEPQMNTDKHG